MVLFAAAAFLLIVTSLIGASALRLPSPISFLLAVYLITSSQIVLLTELLSQFDAISRGGYIAGQLVFVFGVAILWIRRGRPWPPRPDLDLGVVRRHPVIVALGFVVAVALLYEAALVVATPPNNWDSMTYHLSRVAAWHQNGAVEHVAGAGLRQNSFPPNAEIEILYTVTFIGRDTLAAAPQFLAQLAILIGIFGLSRRTGFSQSGALFATLVFSSLTLVALESVTTQNDLVVASFVVAAAYFIIDKRSLPLAGVAVGLAVGTKLTGLLALPVLALLAIVVLRDSRRLMQLTASVAVGVVLLGAYGYVSNVAETGGPLGERKLRNDIRPEIGLDATGSTVGRMLFQFADLSGFRVKVAWLEPFEDAGRASFDVLGLPVNPPESTITGFDFDINIRSHEDTSFFGPLGVLLFLPLAVGFTLAWVVRRTRPARGVLAIGLLLAVVELALVSDYNPFFGRLLLPAVALVAPLVAWVYGRRILTGLVALLAAATLVYAHLYNVAKPVGLDDTQVVWTLQRPAAQSLTRGEMLSAIVAIEDAVPGSSSIGAVLGHDDWSYPLFGPRLERRVIYLYGRDPLGMAEELSLRWVAFGAGAPRVPARANWSMRSLGDSGWTLVEQQSVGASQ